jgi:hypothetical protein
VIPFREAYTTTINFPTGTVFNYTLPAGRLLNVRIGVDSTELPPGLVFVRIQLALGRGATPVILSTLAQGYVTLTSDLAWPGSPIAPAGDGRGWVTNIGWQLATGPLRVTQTIGQGRRALVVAAQVSLTTSAAIADRSLHTQLLDGGGSVMFTGAGAAVIPGSQIKSGNILPGMGPSQIDVASVVHLPWPTDLDLPTGSTIRVFVNNEQAGDALTAGLLMVGVSWICRRETTHGTACAAARRGRPVSDG